VRQQLGAVKNVTHIVFGAYIERQSAVEKSEVNVVILKTSWTLLKRLPLCSGMSLSIKVERHTEQTSDRSKRLRAKMIHG
jgi:hypothetical protein